MLLRVLGGSAFAVALIGAGPALADKWSDKYPIKEDVPGPCSFESVSAWDYQGQELNILTHAIPVMGEPVELHARQFEELTGAKINVTHAPWGELYSKVMIPFQTGQHVYDIVYGGSHWIGDWGDYLEPVPQKYQQMPQMQQVTATYKGKTMWNGKMAQFPMDGDRHYFKYVAPPFENPDYQEKFKEKYGRDLTVPRTWEEYAEVAEFFNGWDWDDDGELEYGSVEILKRDDLMFNGFVTRVASYAKNPNVQGGFWFDLDTMEPLINTPGFVKGLEMWIDGIDQYMPPGALNIGISEEIFAWGGGQALMSVTWDDAFIQAMEPDSPIRNKVRAGTPMGSHEVWNRRTSKWDHFDEPNVAPYVAQGWAVGVSKFSPNKELAFDWLCFKTNQANTSSDLLVGRYGRNPFREQHFVADFWIKEAGWDPEVAKSFVDTLNYVDKSKNRVFDLRVPGVNQYYQALTASVGKALAKQVSAQQALDEAAAEWKRITKRIGVEAVRTAYKNVVELEDNIR